MLAYSLFNRLPIPLGNVRLDNGETHVWRAFLDSTVAEIPCLYQFLNEDERSRAARFCFKQDRERYVIARGLLREILGHYLGISPERVDICYTPFGKPILPYQPSDNRLHFNLSHSDGLALYAMSRNRRVGIDIERIRPEPVCEQIAVRFFSTREAQALRALPKHAQEEAFFACWTRKEAYLKGRGEGLTAPLDMFEVSLAPGAPAALLSSTEDPEKINRWSLRNLRPICGYAAARAIEGADCQLSEFSINGPDGLM